MIKEQYEADTHHVGLEGRKIKSATQHAAKYAVGPIVFDNSNHSAKVVLVTAHIGKCVVPSEVVKRFETASVIN